MALRSGLNQILHPRFIVQDEFGKAVLKALPVSLTCFFSDPMDSFANFVRSGHTSRVDMRFVKCFLGGGNLENSCRRVSETIRISFTKKGLNGFLY